VTLRFLMLVALSVFSLQLSAKEILLLGDSLTCGPFGAHLLENLSKEGQRVRIYCSVGSGPQQWMDGTRAAVVDRHGKTIGYHDCQSCYTLAGCQGWVNEKGLSGTPGHSCNGSAPNSGTTLVDILSHDKYDEVVVALGTNALGQPLNKSYSDMLELIHRYTNSCKWIGPPHFDGDKSKDAANKEQRLKAFYISMQRLTKDSGACRLLDSREATAKPKAKDTAPDGVHRQPRSASQWADETAEQLQSHRPKSESARVNTSN
jgi:hypothetical protein